MTEYILYNISVNSQDIHLNLLIPLEYDLFPSLMTRMYLKEGILDAVEFLKMFYEENHIIPLSETFLSDGVYDMLLGIFRVEDIYGDLSAFRTFYPPFKSISDSKLPIKCTIVEYVQHVW